jgi:hypothetical protein
VAIYTLAVLLIAFSKPLSHYSPVRKFLTVKLVLALNTFGATGMSWTPYYDYPVHTIKKHTRPFGDYVVTTMCAFEQCCLGFLIWYCYTPDDFKGPKHEFKDSVG